LIAFARSAGVSDGIIIRVIVGPRIIRRLVIVPLTLEAYISVWDIVHCGTLSVPRCGGNLPGNLEDHHPRIAKFLIRFYLLRTTEHSPFREEVVLFGAEFIVVAVRLCAVDATEFSPGERGLRLQQSAVFMQPSRDFSEP
jgi:hypothetical protein